VALGLEELYGDGPAFLSRSATLLAPICGTPSTAAPERTSWLALSIKQKTALKYIQFPRAWKVDYALALRAQAANGGYRSVLVDEKH
jgi:hypothetical protein